MIKRLAVSVGCAGYSLLVLAVGIASADSPLASVDEQSNDLCDSHYMFTVHNNLTDSSVRATVHVNWDKGSDEGSYDQVFTLAPGETQSIACTYDWPDVGFPLHRHASVVGAEQI